MFSKLLLLAPLLGLATAARCPSTINQTFNVTDLIWTRDSGAGDGTDRLLLEFSIWAEFNFEDVRCFIRGRQPSNDPVHRLLVQSMRDTWFHCTVWEFHTAPQVMMVGGQDSLAFEFKEETNCTATGDHGEDLPDDYRTVLITGSMPGSTIDPALDCSFAGNPNGDKARCVLENDIQFAGQVVSGI